MHQTKKRFRNADPIRKRGEYFTALSYLKFPTTDSARANRIGSGSLDHFDDGLGFQNHQVFIEQVEALNEQFMASTFDVKNTQ